jgi:hypothetical protein
MLPPRGVTSAIASNANVSQAGVAEWILVATPKLPIGRVSRHPRRATADCYRLESGLGAAVSRTPSVPIAVARVSGSSRRRTA